MARNRNMNSSFLPGLTAHTRLLAGSRVHGLSFTQNRRNYNSKALDVQSPLLSFFVIFYTETNWPVSVTSSETFDLYATSNSGLILEVADAAFQ
jgi:hypothetical protein